MRQKSHEAAADFLVHVLGAVDGLPKTGRVSSHNMRSRPFCQRCLLTEYKRSLDMFLTLKWPDMES